MNYLKRLIEVDLPVKRISEHYWRGKSIEILNPEKSGDILQTFLYNPYSSSARKPDDRSPRESHPYPVLSHHGEQG